MRLEKFQQCCTNFHLTNKQNHYAELDQSKYKENHIFLHSPLANLVDAIMLYYSTLLKTIYNRAHSQNNGNIICKLAVCLVLNECLASCISYEIPNKIQCAFKIFKHLILVIALHTVSFAGQVLKQLDPTQRSN